MKRTKHEEACSNAPVKRQRTSVVHFPIEILQCILEYSDFVSQLRLTCLSKLCRSKLLIKKICQWVSNDTLKQSKYRNLLLIIYKPKKDEDKKAREKHKLDSVPTIQVLYSGCITFKDCTSTAMNLKFLRIAWDEMPTNTNVISKLVFLRIDLSLYISCGILVLSNIPTLKCLVMGGIHGIKNMDTLKNMNLKNLEYLEIQQQYVDQLKDITFIRALDIHIGGIYPYRVELEPDIDINHLKSLELLGRCGGRKQHKGFMGLTQLRFLNLSRNILIQDLSSFNNLEYLNISSTTIQNGAIFELKSDKMETLIISYTSYISDLNALPNLTFLDARESKITQDGISCLKKIRILNISYTEVTDINHMTQLQILDAEGDTLKMGDKGIKEINNITELDISHNQNITDINNMTKLNKLLARCSKINDKGTSSLSNLVVLDIYGTKDITNIDHMVWLKYINAVQSGVEVIRYENFYDLKASVLNEDDCDSSSDEYTDVDAVVDTSVIKDPWDKIRESFMRQACGKDFPSVLDKESFSLLTQ